MLLPETSTSERTTALRYPNIRRSLKSREVVVTFADESQAQEAYRWITTILSLTKVDQSVAYFAQNAIVSWDTLRTLLRELFE